ncbi:PE-PPE domain-containing protein [Mycobacterium sp.]|uniref:PE-PPE domain-containing protein n=2 Tax=Mycobacterium sp. TaxID=1785 RepID=UPI0031E2EC79
MTSAGFLALIALTNPPLASGDVPPDPADPTTVGLVMGGSGQPLPNFNVPDYVEHADEFYIHPNFPDTTYPAPYADGLFTPEYPVFSMPFSLNDPNATTGPLAGFPDLYTSMGQDMLIVENAIASNQAAGDISTVFGYSQSSTVSSLVMQQLDPSSTPEPDDGLQFVLVGDPSAPNGGLLERFDGLSLPSLGLSFDGATPADDLPTDIYTIEYDGYADFPRYPIDVLADLNALAGTIFIHGLYLDPSVISSDVLDKAFLLPGSEGLGADTLTNYYMIPLSALPYPDDNLPLLQPLLGIPVVGKPLVDLIQPDLTVLVNLGYGVDNLGYSTPANVPTPIGLFPDVNPATVLNELAAGAQQGVSAFGSDMSDLSLSSLVPTASPAPLASLTDLVTGLSVAASDPAATITDVVNAFTSAGASLSALQLQTTDIVNAVLTSLPAYDISLVQEHLSNPLDAIGLPIAADTGLLTLVAGFEFELVDQAITGVIDDFAALAP